MNFDDHTAEAVRAYVQAGKRGLGLFEAMKCAVEAAVLEEREACALTVEAEKLCEPTDGEGDQAYDTAIAHAAKSIRMRSNA